MPSRSTRKPARAKRIRAKTRDTQLSAELVQLYAVDASGTGSPLLFVQPSASRWLRRVALVGPVLVLMHAMLVYVLPFFSHVVQRPELALFRFGE